MKLSKISFVSILGVLIIVMFSFNTAESKKNDNSNYDLKYSLTEGTKFILTVDLVRNQMTEQCGDNVTGKLDAKYELEFEVLNVDNSGNMEVSAEFKNVKHFFAHPLGDINTDFSPLFGKKVSFTLAPNGETSGFKGFDELPEIKNIKSTITEDDLIFQFSKLFPVLPGVPKSMGESWVQESNIEKEELVLITKNTYKIVEESNKEGMDCIKIEATQEITESRLQYQQDEQCATEIEIDLEGEGKFFIWFDFKRGFIIEIVGNSTKEGLARAGEIEIPTSIEETLTTKIKLIQ